MSVTVTGLLEPSYRTAESLSCCKTWQSLCGAPTEAEARNNIYVSQATVEDYPLPYCGVLLGDDFQRETNSTGCWETHGSVELWMTMHVPKVTDQDETIEDDTDALAWVANIIGDENYGLLYQLGVNRYVTNPWRPTGCHQWFQAADMLMEPWLHPYEEEPIDAETPENWSRRRAGFVLGLTF